jgi:hypothetical protein
VQDADSDESTTRLSLPHFDLITHRVQSLDMHGDLEEIQRLGAIQGLYRCRAYREL